LVSREKISDVKVKSKVKSSVKSLKNLNPLQKSPKVVSKKRINLNENSYESKYLQLSELLNNTTLAVIEWDSNSKVKYWNKQAEKIFGWKSSEAIGKNINKKIVPKEDFAQMQENVKLLLKNKISTNTNENRNLTKDNKIIYCRWFNSILRDNNGKVISVLSLVQDKTLSKISETEKEIAIYNLNERVKELSLLNNISKILQNPEMEIEESFQKIIDIIPSGWQFPEITECRILFDDKKFNSKNFSEKSKWILSSEFLTNDGKKFSIEIIYLIKKPYDFEGPFLKEERNLINIIAAMIKTYLDNRNSEIVRKKLVNDLIHRNITLEKFAFMVSHILRAPIANILGIAELLKETDLENNVKTELLEDLKSSVTKFDSVLNLLNLLLKSNEKTN